MSKFVLHVNDKHREQIRANAHALIDQLDAKRAWKIEIVQYRKERSDVQNSALWGLAYPIVRDATGEDVNEWHEYFLGEYFGWIERDYFGKRKLRPARTTTTNFDGKPEKLSTEEFAKFFDFIQRRCGANGIHIPDPDPFWKEAKAA